jgi:hypothetical protein
MHTSQNPSDKMVLLPISRSTIIRPESGPMDFDSKTKHERIDEEELALVRLGGDGCPLCD